MTTEHTPTVKELQTKGLRRCMVCGTNTEPKTRIHLSRAGYPYCETHIDQMPAYATLVKRQSHDCYRCEDKESKMTEQTNRMSQEQYEERRNEMIVAHDQSHETIDCPHCGIALCAHYPADGDTGEACETTYYATGVDHVLDCGRE